jgi:hypothetical protein
MSCPDHPTNNESHTSWRTLCPVQKAVSHRYERIQDFRADSKHSEQFLLLSERTRDCRPQNLHNMYQGQFERIVDMALHFVERNSWEYRVQQETQGATAWRKLRVFWAAARGGTFLLLVIVSLRRRALVLFPFPILIILSHDAL